jgi:hypothetical protein
MPLSEDEKRRLLTQMFLSVNDAVLSMIQASMSLNKKLLDETAGEALQSALDSSKALHSALTG